jgi:hypothetical protein
MDSHIMIAHAMRDDEALALLAESAAASGTCRPTRDLVDVRVTPASVRASRFVPVGPSARTNAQHLLEGTS